MIDFGQDLEFQITVSLAFGFLWGGISWGLAWSLLGIVLYEIWVCWITQYYGCAVRTVDRVIVNLFFFIGWILARILTRQSLGEEEDIWNEFWRGLNGRIEGQ